MVRTIKNYRKMSKDELEELIKQNKIGITKSWGLVGKSDGKGSPIKGTAKEGVVRRLRKENARILTVLNERRENV